MDILKHLCFFLLLFLFSRVTAQDLSVKVQSEIEGAWVWVSTRNCAVKGSSVETSDNSKEIRKIIFYKNNKMDEYVNGKKTGTYAYTIRHAKVSANREELYFESEKLSGSLFVTPRDLTISTCSQEGKHVRFKRTH